MDDIRKLIDTITDLEESVEIQLHDSFDIELGDIIIESGVVDFTDDGIVIAGDDKIIELLTQNGVLTESVEKDDEEDLYGPEYQDMVARVGEKAKQQQALAKKGKEPRVRYNEKTKKYYVDFSDPDEKVSEAEYQGREVPLGKPMSGDVKKSKVYVRGPKGNVVKVNFGDKNMRIKKSNPGRRKSFRARHHCENPGPRWKARYWSCRAW